MTTVENACQPNAGSKGSDANSMDLVIDNVAVSSEIGGVYDFVVAVFFVAVEILRLAAMS